MGIAWEMMAFAGAATSLCVGCLVPNRWLPPLPNDKLMHFLAFALLTALGLRIADSASESLLWMLGLLVAGWLIECLQALVPGRGYCWRDLGANAAGIACVGLVWTIL